MREGSEPQEEVVNKTENKTLIPNPGLRANNDTTSTLKQVISTLMRVISNYNMPTATVLSRMILLIINPTESESDDSALDHASRLPRAVG